jgi:hypothetical protein
MQKLKLPTASENGTMVIMKALPLRLSKRSAKSAGRKLGTYGVMDVLVESMCPSCYDVIVLSILYRSPADVTKRADALIEDLRQRFHTDAIGKPQGEGPPCDVLIIAHGHILRSFAARWIRKDIADNPSLILEAGGVGTLSYEHHSIDEPAILLGGAFAVD